MVAEVLCVGNLPTKNRETEDSEPDREEGEEALVTQEAGVSRRVCPRRAEQVLGSAPEEAGKE